MKILGRQISPDVKQIDIDVLRTFRNHIMYRDRYGIKQQALFHVLVAYSMYNPVSITYLFTSNFSAILTPVVSSFILALLYMYLCAFTVFVIVKTVH